MPDYLNIAGRVRTTAADGVVAEAQEVKDLLKNKSQQELNNDFSTAIEAILLLIPSAASSLNQLADKAFVNSSIATASATFRGTYNLVSDLNLTVSATHAQIGAALAGAVVDEDNNDYAFVQIPTSDATPTQIAKTERYKFNGTAWEYEYDLNNSGYTADQWAAINSGITAALVSKLSALPTNAELTTTLGLLSDGIASINGKIPAEATTSNKLVDTAAMQSYVTQIINAIDATFNVTSTDGHVTVQITQVNGVITNVAVTTSDIASAAALTLVTGRVTDAEANIVSLGGRMTTAETDIDDLQQLYNNLQQSAPQVIDPTDTWPVANPSTTVIYRVVDRVNTPPQYYSDYMFRASDLTTPVLMATYNNAIDPRPKKGSQNLVTSGGVFDNMGALDVSELNATENPHTLATYADLSAALAAIPSDYQKGGMSIKFVQSSDNKYVQFRLMHPLDNPSTVATDFANTANWQGVDAKPTPGSKNFVESGGVKKSLLEMGGVVYQDSGSGAKCVNYDFIAGLTYVLVNTGSVNYTGVMSKSTSDSTSTVGVVETIGSLQAGRTVEFTASEDASYLRYYGNGEDASFYIVEKDTYAQAIKELQLNSYTKEQVNYIVGNIFNKSYTNVGNKNLDTIHLVKGTYKLYSDVININLYQVVGTVLITTSVPQKWVDFTIDEDMDVLINHSTSQGTTTDCVVKIERGLYHELGVVTDIVYKNYSSKYFANGVNIPYLPLIKELYLTGLNSEHTYEFRIYKGSSWTAQIWDGSTYVAGAGINFNNQVHKFKSQNSSGISGYIVVDLEKVKENNTLSKEVIVQNVATNISESPIIQAYTLDKDIIVEKDGSGDFSSLTEAILFATQWPDRIVRVGDGTYDIKEEYKALYGDDYFDTWHDDVGIILKNRVHVIFNSNSKVVYHYTGDNDSYLTLFSPFNGGADGFTLENLTIECSNCRYCVHDDPSGSIKYHNKYINCTMYMDNSDNVRWDSKQCIGGGMSLSGRVDILNCRFSSVGITSEYPAIVSYHNTSLENARSNIIVSGCYFEGIGTFRLSWYGTTTLKSVAEVSNCSLGSPLIHSAESPSYDIRNTELLAWNNEIRS